MAIPGKCFHYGLTRASCCGHLFRCLDVSRLITGSFLEDQGLWSSLDPAHWPLFTIMNENFCSFTKHNGFVRNPIFAFFRVYILTAECIVTWLIITMPSSHRSASKSELILGPIGTGLGTRSPTGPFSVFFEISIKHWKRSEEGLFKRERSAETTPQKGFVFRWLPTCLDSAWCWAEVDINTPSSIDFGDVSEDLFPVKNPTFLLKEYFPSPIWTETPVVAKLIAVQSQVLVSNRSHWNFVKTKPKQSTWARQRPAQAREPEHQIIHTSLLGA